MTCREAREYLFAFLDNELDAALSMEMQRHLEHCPACARESEIEQVVRRQLIQCLAPSDDVPELDQVGYVRLFSSPPARPRRWKLRRLAIGSAVAAALAITTFLATGRHAAISMTAAFADVLVQDVEHFIAEGKPLQIKSSDAGVVSDWLRDQTSLAVEVPIADASRATLLGGRKCKLAGDTAAFVAYQMDGQVVTMIALSKPAEVLSGMKRMDHDGHTYWVDRCKGHTIVACRKGELVYAAVSRLPGDALVGLMQSSVN